MKQFWFQITGLIIVIVVGTYLSFSPSLLNSLIPDTDRSPADSTSGNFIKSKIRIVSSPLSGSEVIRTELTVEVADSKEERGKGLGGRDALCLTCGMLFVFDSPGQYQFWMKGLKFPLDLIFISENRVVDIIQNVPPPTPGQSENQLPKYSSTQNFDKVLEVNGGFVKNSNIQVGDKIVSVAQ